MFRAINYRVIKAVTQLAYEISEPGGAEVRERRQTTGVSISRDVCECVNAWECRSVR